MGYYGDLTTAHAAMYSFASGTWTTLPDIAGMPNNEGYGINKSGVAVGVAGVGDFNYPSTVTAWIWDPNSQSYSFFAAPGAQPNSTYDAAINDSGQVVGSFVDASGATRGYLKDGDTYTTIDAPRATATLPNGINNSGTIVGGWGNNSVPLAGFVRTSDGALTVVRFPGAVETEIGGINEHGDICGFWAAPNDTVFKAFVGYKQ